MTISIYWGGNQVWGSQVTQVAGGRTEAELRCFPSSVSSPICCAVYMDHPLMLSWHGKRRPGKMAHQVVNESHSHTVLPVTLSLLVLTQGRNRIKAFCTVRQPGGTHTCELIAGASGQRGWNIGLLLFFFENPVASCTFLRSIYLTISYWGQRKLAIRAKRAE